MVKTGGEVTERYSYTTKGRAVTFTDGKGSDYVYSFDEFGRIISEKNRFDGTQNYTYNENAELKSKKDFKGNMTAVSYDTRTRTKSTSYADGASSYFSTDKYGTVQADYSYDVFGSPYLGNLENDIGFGYCGKTYDVGTGLYDYGFRDYSPVSARFTTIDPIRDGSNWFAYVVNDPVNYVDPFGLKPCKTASDNEKGESTKILAEIEKLQKEMAEWQRKGGEISLSQFEMFMSLAAKYNNALIAEGNLSVSDYVSDGIITTDFEKTQEAVGNYRVNFHTGIDVIGGDLKSPFFLTATDGNEKGSNGKVFSIIGTDLKMKVLHGDAGSVKKTGDFFKPGDIIMDFPTKNNFQNASTGPHFHIEISNGKNFVNPFTLKQSDKNFMTTYTGGKTWVKSNYAF